MKDNGLVCWKCGTSIGDEPLPLGRLAECRACRAQLHVCRLCTFYDTRVAKSCRETVAEEVKDKERANFCGYFQPRPGAHAAGDGRSQAARQELDALFGTGTSSGQPTAQNAQDALRGLFQKNDRAQ
jgi:hypothetical protein